jgi:hypothetical protein
MLFKQESAGTPGSRHAKYIQDTQSTFKTRKVHSRHAKYICRGVETSPTLIESPCSAKPMACCMVPHGYLGYPHPMWSEPPSQYTTITRVSAHLSLDMLVWIRVWNDSMLEFKRARKSKRYSEIGLFWICRQEFVYYMGKGDTCREAF